LQVQHLGSIDGTGEARDDVSFRDDVHSVGNRLFGQFFLHDLVPFSFLHDFDAKVLAEPGS
jgi:hypothetical protein